MPYNQDGSQGDTEELTKSINTGICCRSFSRLTRVGVGASVQDCGVWNVDFLHLTAPVAMGNAAWFGAGVA